MNNGEDKFAQLINFCEELGSALRDIAALIDELREESGLQRRIGELERRVTVLEEMKYAQSEVSIPTINSSIAAIGQNDEKDCYELKSERVNSEYGLCDNLPGEKRGFKAQSSANWNELVKDAILTKDYCGVDIANPVKGKGHCNDEERRRLQADNFKKEEDDFLKAYRSDEGYPQLLANSSRLTLTDEAASMLVDLENLNKWAYLAKEEKEQIYLVETHREQKYIARQFSYKDEKGLTYFFVAPKKGAYFNRATVLRNAYIAYFDMDIDKLPESGTVVYNISEPAIFKKQDGMYILAHPGKIAFS